ncbi:MAG: hypothetical protein QOE70_2847 [Chthoniobacter sp.]|jgi:PAS domain S-box-containing protein|nr:hypothetical protein [Chthoniobacter sp.]
MNQTSPALGQNGHSTALHDDATAVRAGVLFAEQNDANLRRTDRWFASLLLLEWLVGIVFALTISPTNWAGQFSETHIHVWAALFLGGGIVVFPVALALLRPGAPVTRHAIAVAQMLIGALYIHLTGGRIETHFHVFGSLAFLAVYRDWRVLITGTVVVAGDHFLRGVFWPQSVYGVLSASLWRAVEHAGWVVFEDVFLIRSCLSGIREMHSIAERQAATESLNATLTFEVAERKRAEEQLRERQGLLDAVVQGSTDTIFVKDKEGRYLMMNAAGERLLGRSQEEIIGHDDAELFQSKMACSFTEMDRAIMTAGETRTFEEQFNRANGNVELLTTKVPYFNAHGAIIGVIGIAHDITERKRYEQELRDAKEAAEAASRAKGDFLATMSHEIRTPMNGVIGSMGLLLDTELLPRQRELAGIARNSAEALLGIVNDILDFSKVEAGKLSIEPMPFDLLVTVEEVSEMFCVRMQEKGLELILRYAPGTPRRLIGDAGRIRQVLVNLVGNAVKFTERGHVLVSIESEDQGDGRAALRIIVADTGIGIAPDALEWLFERFTQADASTTRRFGGSGLGLAISKRLVELMGGKLSVRSHPGEGSTFTCLLPLPLDTAAPPPALATTDVTGLRALVVADNPVNRQVLHEQVTGWKMRNGSTASGREALGVLRSAAAARDPYDIAVLDCQLADMDADTLAAAIKTDPQLRDAALVLLTSPAGRHAEEMKREGHFAVALVKPVKPSALFNAIVAALAGRKAEPRTGLVRAATTVRPAHRSNARVLVVDDNGTNQRVAQLTLESQGCRVDLAANGAEAIEMLRRLPYRLVFMDCEMPEMDGFEATRRIRELEAQITCGQAAADPNSSFAPNRRIAIVAMTAKALSGDRERCLAAGMDDYLSKPLQLPRIEKALAKWLPESSPVSAPVAEAPVFRESAAPAASSALDGEIIDRWKRLAARTDPALLVAIFTTFLEETPIQIERLREACGQNHAEHVRREAHTLRGASLNLGAHGIAALCRRLETEPLDLGSELPAQLFVEFERVCPEIERELSAARML